MKRLRRGWRRLKGVVPSVEREADLRSEIASHIAMQTEENLRAGMSESEARRAAAIKFGPLEDIKATYREQCGLPFLSAAVAEFGYAWRSLTKNPGFALVAVLTLGLGIGANTAAFSLVDQVLLHPPGVSEPERIAVLRTSYDNLGLSFELASAGALAASEQEKDVFESAAGLREISLTYAGSDSPQRLPGAAVSAGWFQVYGARPELGRVFTVQEDKSGANRVVVLAHGAWERLFGGAPDAIGGSIHLNGQSYRVIGVMGPDFQQPRDADLWVPLALPPQAISPQSWFPENLSVVARLRPGVTLEQADRFLKAQVSTVLEQVPPQGSRTLSDAGWRIDTASFLDSSARVARTPLLILLGAVGVILLIACSNVAGLMLARTSARMRELGVRLALGATRARLRASVFSEGLLLAVLGGLLGLAIAEPAARVLIALAPASANIGVEPRTDGYVLGFALAASLTSTLIFGLVPLHHLSTVAMRRLTSGSRGYSWNAHTGLRSGLVVGQTALALVLLTAAGLFLQSIQRLQLVDTGFNPHGVMTASFSLPEGEGDRGPAAFIGAVLDRLDHSAGVDSAAIGRPIPFSGILESGAFYIEGRTVAQGEPVPLSDRRWVTPGYLDTLEIPLRNGRFFADEDRMGAELVAVIDDRLARQYWPDEDPVGQRILLSAGISEPLRIVGVVGHVRQSDLASDADSGVLYLSMLQNPLPFGSLTVRGADDAVLVGAMREAVREVDPSLPLYDVRSMESIVSDSLAPRLFLLRVFWFFAATALFLATLGLYGVVCYAVSLRTREIGIRLAVGAGRAAVMTSVMGQALRLTAIGSTIGIVLSVVGTRLARSQSFEVAAGVRFVRTQLLETSPFDPLATLGLTALVLLGAALLAGFVPARRAGRMDPMTILRQE